jgi:Arc/MetJ family transcription regulator
MRRATNASNISDIIKEAVAAVVSRTSKAIDDAIRAAVAQRLRAEPGRSRTRGPVRREFPVRRGRPARTEITRWVADRRARRLPTFVIEATGLDTKKEIVARYGRNAAFTKGKPLPVAKSRAEAAETLAKHARPAVTAKPPFIRKAAARR